MTPTSQQQPVLLIPQQQQPHQAAAPPPSTGRLSFDDVSKQFSLPIAEAASNLGVCTSVLKRICRKNGIGRWPYRKFLAGKTVEEIKRDAAREKAKEQAELAKGAKQRLDVSNLTALSSVGLPSTFGNQTLYRTPGLAQETSKMQSGVSIPGHVLQQQDNKYFQYKWPGMAQFNPAKNVPTYMDEFKYGFPSKGLSSVSMKWWGSSNDEGIERTLPGEPTTEEEEKKGSCGLSNETSLFMTIGDQTDSTSEGSARAVKAEPTSLLCSLRKRAVDGGHDSVKDESSKVCATNRVSKRQRLLLHQIFKSSLPDQWKKMHC